MPSVRRIGKYASQRCVALTDAVFGEKLERIDKYPFNRRRDSPLRRIAIPLKDGLFRGYDNTLKCDSLSRVDIVGAITTLSHRCTWRRGEMI